MKEIQMGIIRVLTLEDTTEVAKHGRIIENSFPSISTISECIPDHPQGIPSPAEEDEAIPYILDLGHSLATSVDAIGISCALDPGVSSLREELDIPVFGAGSSVAAVALGGGTRFGTLAIEGGVAPIIEEMLGEKHHSSITIEGADTTNYLATQEGQKILTESVKALSNQGCDVIVPSCTGMSTTGVLPKVNREVRATVLDPVVAMGAMATTYVD